MASPKTVTISTSRPSVNVTPETYWDMMKALNTELESIKLGAIPESTGRVVLGYRKAQLKNVELHLQSQRLHKARPAGNLLLGKKEEAKK